MAGSNPMHLCDFFEYSAKYNLDWKNSNGGKGIHISELDAFAYKIFNNSENENLEFADKVAWLSTRCHLDKIGNRDEYVSFQEIVDLAGYDKFAYEQFDEHTECTLDTSDSAAILDNGIENLRDIHNFLEDCDCNTF